MAGTQLLPNTVGTSLQFLCGVDEDRSSGKPIYGFTIPLSTDGNGYCRVAKRVITLAHLIVLVEQYNHRELYARTWECINRKCCDSIGMLWVKWTYQSETDALEDDCSLCRNYQDFSMKLELVAGLEMFF